MCRAEQGALRAVAVTVDHPKIPANRPVRAAVGRSRRRVSRPENPPAPSCSTTLPPSVASSRRAGSCAARTPARVAVPGRRSGRGCPAKTPLGGGTSPGRKRPSSRTYQSRRRRSPRRLRRLRRGSRLAGAAAHQARSQDARPPRPSIDSSARSSRSPRARHRLRSDPSIRGRNPARAKAFRAAASGVQTPDDLEERRGCRAFKGAQAQVARAAAQATLAWSWLH